MVHAGAWAHFQQHKPKQAELINSILKPKAQMQTENISIAGYPKMLAVPNHFWSLRQIKRNHKLRASKLTDEVRNHLAIDYPIQASEMFCKAIHVRS